MGLVTAPWHDRNKMALGFSPLTHNESEGGGIMSEMTVIQVMLLICSLMCSVATMAYRLGKDMHGARKRTRRHKRSRRSRK